MGDNIIELRIMAEISRKGSTRESIAALYREGIIFGDVCWHDVNYAILQRYAVSGLNRIKALAWGTKKRTATYTERSST